MIIKSILAVTASSLNTCGCIPSGPMNLSMFSSYYSTFLYTKGKSSLLLVFPVTLWAQDSWRQVSSVKTEATEALSTLASCMSFVTYAIQQQPHIFSTLPHAANIPIEGLPAAFHVLWQPPGRFWISCPHPCMLRTVSIPPGSPCTFLCFHFIYLLVCSSVQVSHHNCSPVSQNASFFGSGRTNQLSWTPPLFGTISYGILSSKSLNRIVYSPEVQSHDST